MSIPPQQPASREPAPAGRQPVCLVVDIGLSCPSCRVQLTLPSAFLGQVVTGPCPMCGWTLVFCHGRIESVPEPAGFDWAAAVNEAADRTPPPMRTKLLRSGTLGVSYLEEPAGPGGREGSGWAGRGRPAAEDEWSPSPPPGGGRARWWGLGLLAVLGLAGGTVWFLARPSAPLPAPRDPAPSAGTPVRQSIPDGWAAAARETWLAFARATTTEEKLAQVLDPERVAPALRAFYAGSSNADAPWEALAFEPLAGTADDRRRGVMALGCAPPSPGAPPLILFLRAVLPSTGDPAEGAALPPRFRLDWETYIQERDGLVEKFFRDPDAPRTVFRLAVERVHVFDETGVPRAGEEPLGLKLRTPSGVLLSRVAEVSPRTALYARIDEQLRWGLPVYATVQLAWDRKTGPEPRVVLADLVCWQLAGLGGIPEFETELSPLPAPLKPAP